MSTAIPTDAVLKLLQQLIRIPSVNPSLASDEKAGGAGEAAGAALGDDGVAGRVMVALVVDEEYASIGADAFVKRHEANGGSSDPQP